MGFKVVIVGGSVSGLSLANMLEKSNIETGYPQIFIDRQMLLQVLYDNLHFKDRVLTRKRVIRVDTVEGCVHVQTEDGSRYVGDVVAADGVHSAVRKEMRRNGLESDPELFQAGKDDGS
ncbi:hypothetical protein INS49_010514 [Diaporthe citri]|uniref:uncharacterized protein n=1 Tax=Diaporthe citri TaxID=83186 RepID=UPI001C7E7B38|nr:uncharacterized protein INS49_010514 [Diaporthe citri]KAG6362284.1 hypothetical protein INS49_010514 [Diaporthe citri]